MKNIINGDGINLMTLDINEELDHLQLPAGITYIQQGCDLFKVKNVVGILSLIPATDELKDIKLLLPDPLYKQDSVYPIVDNISNNKLTFDMFAYIMRYFQEIYNKHKTESCILLMLNTKTNDWKFIVPVQVDTSGGAVKYLNPVNVEDNKVFEAVQENKEAKEQHELVVKEYNALYNKGYRIAGTIHSHCDFGAYHSGVDDADEVDFDGLHITIGNVNSGWSFSARVAISGAFFDKPIDGCVVDFNLDKLNEVAATIELEQNHLDRLRPDVETNKSNRATVLWERYVDDTPDNEDYGRLDFIQEYQGNFTNFNDNKEEDDLWYLDDNFVYEDELDEMIRMKHADTGKVVLITESDYDENEHRLRNHGWKRVKR